MQRSIGKRIRMDEPPPPEYDTTNPMTPHMDDMNGMDNNDMQDEPYTPYGGYHQQATPLHSNNELYSDYQQQEVLQNYENPQSVINTGQQPMSYEVQGQYTDGSSPLQPAPEHVEEPVEESHEEPAYESPLTPINLRGGRITRSRLRNLLQSNQYGSTPQMSTTKTLHKAVSTIKEALAAKEHALVISLDIKDANNPQPPQPPTPPTPKRMRYEERVTRPRRGPPRKTYAENSNDDNEILYHIIKNGRIALQTVVDDWIEAYKVNRDNALLALMQFFIHASGCKGKITSTMAASMEHAAIIRRMTEEFDEESGEYPLIMSGQQFKKFKTNFCDFVAQLVKQCQYSIIYDQYLMDNVISLLTGLSDSQVRAFRHTATLAAMKLMTALVDVALVVSVNLDNTQRQYESERQKARDKRASDRLENLLAKRQELEENMDEIKNMLTYMFKSVFVHRYRDTLPEIRAICMAEIGVWMKKFHQNFLDDSYLKYIGWTLHDKVGEVRLKCLQALQPLYASEDLKGKLELFTSKFKDRIVSMTLDKEYDVAVQAVRLVISILKHHRDILTDKDCEHVYELVYSSHRAVAQAAGEFLNERLFVQDEVTAVQRTYRGKKRLPNTPLIRDLVQFFIESELHEHGAYLVDSLIESNAMMKDYECMTDLLLEEPGPNEEPLDDRQETSLIEIMVCCVKQAATGEAPVGRGPTRKIPSVKEIKQVQDDKQKLTEHFIPVLPLLLDKYSADTDKLTNLLIIPQYFHLEIYTTSRQEGNLDLLLKRIHNITEKHHDTEVLETCAKTLEVLCTENYAIYTRCDVQRSTLIDSVVNKYKEAMDDWYSLIEGEETPDDDETYNVINSLKKVSIFYSCHNLGNWNIWPSLYKDVEEAKDGVTSLPEEAVKYCISSCYFALLWDLHHIEEVIESGSPVEDKVVEVHTRLVKFMEVMKCMLAQSNSQVYKEEAYLVVCDLLVVFCNQLSTNSHSALSGLVYEPDKTLQLMLNEFIQRNVFTYEEDDDLDEHSKIAELHKRRNFLASYCKLIVYGILPISCAADVFKHYVKSYNDYGDIIKTTVGKAREINKVNCARTMVTALTALFRELQPGTMRGARMRSLEDFTSLKELAKRFALSFGLDAVKNREAITVLHREGILFAVGAGDDVVDPTGPPPNLPFLEILSEFTNKLLKQDKRIVYVIVQILFILFNIAFPFLIDLRLEKGWIPFNILVLLMLCIILLTTSLFLNQYKAHRDERKIKLSYLDRRISMGMPSSRGEDWQPLLLYRNSLVHGETDQPPITSKRAYSRKRKEIDDESMDDIDDGNSDSEFIPGGDSHHHHRKHHRGDRALSPPQFSNSSPVNYSVESLATSSRPQRQCARFSFCYIDNFSDDEIV